MRTQNTKGADLIPETQTNKSPPSDVLDMMIVMNERDLDVLYSVSLKRRTRQFQKSMARRTTTITVCEQAT